MIFKEGISKGGGRLLREISSKRKKRFLRAFEK